MFHCIMRSSSQALTRLTVMTDSHWERTAKRYHTSHIADLHALGSSVYRTQPSMQVDHTPPSPAASVQLIRDAVPSSQFKTLLTIFMTASGSRGSEAGMRLKQIERQLRYTPLVLRSESTRIRDAHQIKMNRHPQYELVCWRCIGQPSKYTDNAVPVLIDSIEVIVPPAPHKFFIDEVRPRSHRAADTKLSGR